MKNCSHTTDCEVCASNAKMAKRLSNLVDQGFDKVLAQRDAALARAEKAEAREREIGEELDKATGMVEMHVADATAARLLWRQSEAACAKMHAERDAAIASLTIQRDAAEEGAAAAIQMRNESLARAHAAEALARESGRQIVDGISAMLTIANQRDAAIRERDEALAILQDLVTLQDSPSDQYKIDESTESVNVKVDDLTRLKVGQYVAIIARARKLLGGAH